MKILILANHGIGLYNFRKELIETLINKGHSIVISCPWHDKLLYFQTIGCEIITTHVDRRGMNPIKDIKLIHEYKKIMKEHQPDVVLTYTIKCNIYGSIAARKKAKVIMNITGLGSAFEKKGITSKLVVFMYKFATKAVDKIIFENRENMLIFTSATKIDERKCMVVNGAGVNTTEYPYLEMSKQSTTVFLFNGRIMKEKGIDELLYAADKLKKEKFDIEIHIIGGYEESYREVIDQYTKGNMIIYHGFVDDVKDYIKQSSCVVLPSYHEGMSNALLEGASCGRALITTNVAGCKEAVTDGVNGYLVKKYSKEDLFEKMKQFSLLSKEEQIIMGKQSREKMMDEFERSDVIRKVISVL